MPITMPEKEILQRLPSDPYFARYVLRGDRGPVSDYVKMEAWLVVAKKLGASEARKYLPTEQMISAYQTATGKNPLLGLDKSIKGAIFEPLAKQYGQDVAKRMLGVGQSTPPAVEPEPEKTEGSGETPPEATTPTTTGGWGNIYGYTYETGDGLTNVGDLPEVPGSSTGVNIYESGGGQKEDPKTEGGYPDYVGGAQGNKIGDTTPIQQGGTVGIVGGQVVTGNEASLDDQVVSSSGDATNVQDPVKESAINGAAADVVDGKIKAPGDVTGDPGETDGDPEANIGNGDKNNGVKTEIPYSSTPTPTGTPTAGGGSGDGSESGMPTVPEDETGGGDGSGSGMPTVPEDETGGGDDDTGDEFDEKLKKNEEIGNLNIREGAMTYEEWMRAAGIDTQRDFNAAAKAAAKEYDRSLGTYGATAEAMGRAGLSGSGYSDYLTGNAYAARQGSIDTARQTKTLADDASRQGYMNYLQDYEDGQRGNIAAAIGELSAMGLTGDKAKQYLSMMGIDAGYADYVVGIVDEMAAEGDPDKQALLAEILNNDLSGDAAMSYAKFLGFDDATAAEVIGMADQLSAAGKTAQADALRANVYANLLSMGLTGADAIYFATEISGMDEESAKALVAQTDALLEKQAAANAAEAESELDSITVDVSGDDIRSLRSLYKNASAQSASGAGMISVSELAIFPVAERVAIQQTLNSISDPVARVEKLLAYIADHYRIEGYTEPQIKKILSLIEGGV